MNSYSNDFALDIVGGGNYSGGGKTTNVILGFGVIIGLIIVALIVVFVVMQNMSNANNMNNNSVNSESTPNRNSENQPSINPCNVSATNRPCHDYNILYHRGAKVVCPPGFQLSNEGTCDRQENTNGECEWDSTNRCDPREYHVPCYGRWPNNSWAVPEPGVKSGDGNTVLWGDRKWSTNPIPATMVCGV